MISKDPSEPLKNGISDYYASGLFSDLEIRASNGAVHRVHKLVVSAQCKFLADAINPLYGFKPRPSAVAAPLLLQQESQTSVIQLKHDQHIVAALIEYLYRFDYAVPEDLAASKAADADSPSSNRDGRQHPRLNDDDHPPLLFHARLHAAARFYGVAALADLALTRFAAAAAELWRAPGTLAGLVRVLYRDGCCSSSSSFPVTANGGEVCGADDRQCRHGDGMIDLGAGEDGVAALRAAVVQLAVKHFAELARSQEWRDVMDGVGLFSREMCEALVEVEGKKKVAGGYKCGTCGEVVWICLPERKGEADGYIHCILCGHMWLKSAWLERRMEGH